jgi:hypothetical protein
MRRLFAMLTLALFAATNIPAFAAAKSEQAAGFIRHAVELSDIWSTGAVRLRMRVTFEQVKAGAIEAEYEKIWISAQQWRATLSTPDFRSVTIGGAGRVSYLSSAEKKPLRVRQFEEALAALSQSEINSELRYAFQKVHKGVTDTCVEVAGGRFDFVVTGAAVDRRTYAKVVDCFDKAGLFHFVHYDDVVFFYSNFRPFAGKLFPSQISVLQFLTPDDARTVVTAQVVAIERTHDPDQKLFEVPTGADTYPACPAAFGLPLAIKPGKLIKETNPGAPMLPPNSGILSMDVILQGRIGRDGKFHDLVSHSVSPLNDVALNAVRQWEFQPFTVCGNPVEIPTSVLVSFPRSSAPNR